MYRDQVSQLRRRHCHRAAPYGRLTPGLAAAQRIFFGAPSAGGGDRSLLQARRAELVDALKHERELAEELERRLDVAQRRNARQREALRRRRDAERLRREEMEDALDAMRGYVSLRGRPRLELDFDEAVDAGEFDVVSNEAFDEDEEETVTAAPVVISTNRDDEFQPLVVPRPRPASSGVVVQPLPVVYEGDIVTVGGGPQFALPQGLSYNGMSREQVREFMLKHMVPEKAQELQQQQQAHAYPDAN